VSVDWKCRTEQWTDEVCEITKMLSSNALEFRTFWKKYLSMPIIGLEQDQPTAYAVKAALNCYKYASYIETYCIRLLYKGRRVKKYLEAL